MISWRNGHGDNRNKHQLNTNFGDINKNVTKMYELNNNLKSQRKNEESDKEIIQEAYQLFCEGNNAHHLNIMTSGKF